MTALSEMTRGVVPVAVVTLTDSMTLTCAPSAIPPSLVTWVSVKLLSERTLSPSLSTFPAMAAVLAATFPASPSAPSPTAVFRSATSLTSPLPVSPTAVWRASISSSAVPSLVVSPSMAVVFCPILVVFCPMVVVLLFTSPLRVSIWVAFAEACPVTVATSLTSPLSESPTASSSAAILSATPPVSPSPPSPKDASTISSLVSILCSRVDTALADAIWTHSVP